MKLNLKQIEDRTEKIKLIKIMLFKDNSTRDTSDIMRECFNLANLLTLPEVKSLYDRFYKDDVEFV